MPVEPSIVIIASTMRSGSTLAKALLAEADDVLNLPETNFQKQAVVDRILRQHQSGTPPIKLLKKPCWYQETRSYPRLPDVPDLRVVALVRDVYDTVVSLRKMTFRRLAGLVAPLVTSWLARVYWVRVTNSLIELSENQPERVRLVRYEDLIADPIEQTRQLYQFIGSSRQEGTRTYSPPDNYSWRWGSDDGSPRIRSLEVQPPRAREQTDLRLLKLLQQDEIVALRTRLGYLQN